jgi:hypothetical protein
MANYSFKDPGTTGDIKDGAVINSGNFTQLVPGTEIMKDLKLTINGGNFTNVKKQAQWAVNGGNWNQINRCSHLHSDWISKGLPECVVECIHMVSKDVIEIDGVVIDTVYIYEDVLI